MKKHKKRKYRDFFSKGSERFSLFCSEKSGVLEKTDESQKEVQSEE